MKGTTIASRRVTAVSHEGLRRFFAGMVQPSFTTLGLGVGDTSRYVTDLLARFARSDQLYRVRDSRGRRLETVTELLVELMEQWTGSEESYRFEREIDLRRHCGDFALFMSGVFRDHVEGGAYLSYYLTEGSASYRVVGERLQLMGDRRSQMFRFMAEHFEAVSGALDYMRKVYGWNRHFGA